MTDFFSTDDRTQEFPAVPGVDSDLDTRYADDLVVLQDDRVDRDDQDEPDELDDEIEDEFAPRARQKLGLSSKILAVAVILGVGVIGGILTQKHYGTAASTTNRAAAAGGRGGALPTGAGGFGGGQGGAPGAAAATGTGAAATGGATSTGAATATPVVIGTVASVSGYHVVVKNLGGTSVSVTMTAATTITAKVGGLKAGLSVSVVGKADSSGAVTATSITAQ